MEEWKEIRGYEGLYEVSNLGNIKSLEKISYNQYGAKKVQKEKILKPIFNKNIYKVTLFIKGVGKSYSIARLVALHFLDKPKNQKLKVTHIDNNKREDNSINNIMWAKSGYHKYDKKVIEFTKNNNIVNINLPKLSGIYKIINIITEDIYIGSSNNIFKRITDHFWYLRKNISGCKILQKAYNKYGEGNFKVELIEECNNEQLRDREQYYIDILNPKYNIIKNITRRKIIEIKPKNSIKNKRVFTLEQKLKLSEIIKNSKKHKEGLLRSYNKRKDTLTILNKQNFSKPVLQFTKNGEFIKEFSSIAEATKETGKGNIVKCCKNERKTANGYIWKYKNKLSN